MESFNAVGRVSKAPLLEQTSSGKSRLMVGSPLSVQGEFGTRPYQKDGKTQYYTFLRLDKYERLENKEQAAQRKNKNNEESDYPRVGRDEFDY